MHDCTAIHRNNWLIKFADDSTVIGLISNDDEMKYRDEVVQLMWWGKDNHLALNVSKTKELIIGFRNH